MWAFTVPIGVALESRHGRRSIPAACAQDGAGGLDPRSVILAVHDEDRLAFDALRTKLGREHGGANGLRRFSEAELACWPGWPARLGRQEGENTAALDADPTPLLGQLSVLRTRHPGKRHFRVALVGGFGFNLGDTIIGATAWRSGLRTMRSILPGVTADVLLGPSAHPATAGIIGHEDGIERVTFSSPSLQDFSRYDAYFDFSSLVRLPRFHDMPAVDWVLWWLGIDPAAVPPAEKRNRLRLPPDAWSWAEAGLARAERPRVAFVWEASTPLRSMPLDVAASFAGALLDVAPQMTLVVDRPLPLDRPRVLQLPADSAERMMALVAQADGLISVDSLAPHVADAAGVPALMLLATLAPERFPYYPGASIVVPAGMEQLGGWGRTKVPDEEWGGLAPDYQRVWAGLSPDVCWRLLSERMGRASSSALSLGQARHSGEGSILAPGAPFPHDVVDTLPDWIDREMARFAPLALRPGTTCVAAGGDHRVLTPSLARAVAPGGALHVLEPRRLRAQKLSADIQALGLTTLWLHPAMAGEEAGRASIPDFDPAGESRASLWGNLAGLVPVSAVRLDDLDLAECHLLVLRPPQDVIEALRGAASLLRRTRPFVFAGPLPAAALDGLRPILRAAEYRGWLSAPDGMPRAEVLCLAAPGETTSRFEGFAPL